MKHPFTKKINSIFMENRTSDFLSEFETMLLSALKCRKDKMEKIDSALKFLKTECRNIDWFIESLENKIECQQDTIGCTESEKLELRNHVIIKIDSLKMQNKIEEFVEKELPQCHCEFVGSL